MHEDVLLVPGTDAAEIETVLSNAMQRARIPDL